MTRQQLSEIESRLKAMCELEESALKTAVATGAEAVKLAKDSLTECGRLTGSLLSHQAELDDVRNQLNSRPSLSA